MDKRLRDGTNTLGRVLFLLYTIIGYQTRLPVISVRPANNYDKNFFVTVYTIIRSINSSWKYFCRFYFQKNVPAK